MVTKAIDLYCGAGGLSLGFEMAGIRVVGSNDIWKAALTTYEANRQGVKVILGSLANPRVQRQIIDIGRSEKVEVVIGGPPCQAFSIAGEMKGKGMPADMTPLFARIAVLIRPKWIVMENVNTLLTVGKRQLRNCMSILKRAGYGVTLKVLNAADYGVPQVRRRLILIGRQMGKDV